MNSCRVLIFLLLLLAASTVAAQNALYIGEAPVDATAGASGDPLLDALNQVLIRITGQAGRDLVKELGISTERARAMTLGRQFREVPMVAANGQIRMQRRLRVDFDPRAVDALVDQSGLARWGRERPEFLVWLAIDRGSGFDYLVEDAAIDAALAQTTFEYGLPLARPILDAQDRVEVTPSDIRGGFTAVAVPAQARYGADGLVLLELRQTGEFWSGRWAWRIDETEQTFQRSGSNPAEVINLGFGQIAAALAARFAVRPDALRSQHVTVTSIELPVHYVEARRFLEGLTGVEQVRVVAAEGDRVRFELQSSSAELRQRIQLTGPLKFERADLSSGELFYRFAW